MSLTQPDGYLAMPAAGKGKAVLVLHAWWGLNDTIRTFCTRLADAGFVVFAPDLYHGKVTNQISEAETFGGALDATADQAKAEIIEATAFLKERAGESSVTVIGFSLGAYYALDLSINAPDSIRSVVLFYGTGPDDFSKSKADYLGHFAANDPYEPPEAVNALEQAIKQTGRPVTFYQYSGTGHWFFEPDREVYNETAATMAWERTLAFLKRTPSA